MTATTGEELQRRFGIPGVARFEQGAGGLPRLRVTTDGAEADVYLHGGHVTHFQPRGTGPVLFLSARSKFGAGAAIRGGVPVIFPWFGARAGDPAAPAHGFARTAAWGVESVERAADGAVTAVLRLEPDEAMRAVWPHAFVLRHRVRVGAALDMTLELENRSSAPLVFEEALHTYLAVADVRQITVTGLAGTRYVDKTAAMAMRLQGAEPLRLTGETDSVYLATRAACVLDDPRGGRRLVVEKDGADTTVVWNPWAAKAKAMSDLGDEEWPSFVCVETANAADDRVTLAPGGRHAMRATLRVDQL